MNRPSHALARLDVRPLMFPGLVALLLCAALLAALDSRPAAALSQHALPDDTHQICDTVQQLTLVECQKLVDFYNATGGDTWFNNSGWLQTSTPCTDWFGVSCFGNSVSRLDLISNTLTGTLPPVLYTMTELRALDLRDNDLEGELAPDLAQLTKLAGLNLQGNRFSGELTGINWAAFTQLIHLRLHNNDFSGNLPPDWGNLENLTVLEVYNNNFSGPIPPEFGGQCTAGTNGLCNLITLHIGGQRANLTGPLPATLGNLTQLQNLNVADNRIDGELPATLQNLSELRRLEISQNRIGGELPDFAGLDQLTHLRLDGNAFTGTIPSALGAQINLSELWLHNNQLRGPVPAPVACLRSQGVDLNLAGNLLTVNDPAAADCLDLPAGLGAQTVPPEDLRIEQTGETSVTLAWTPIYRPFDPGRYEIGVSQSPQAIPETFVPTAGKQISSFNVTGLAPDTGYYFFVRTYSPPKGDQTYDQISTFSDPIVGTRTKGPAPRLTFQKEVTPTQAAPGEIVTFTLTLAASGGPAEAVTLTDTLPLSMTLLEITTGNAVYTGGMVRFSGTVAENSPTVIRYRARLNDNVPSGSVLYSLANANRPTGDNFVAATAVVVPAPAPISNLILIYAVGDNNLSPHLHDLFRKAEAADKPDDMVVILLLDDAETDGAYVYRLQNAQSAPDCPTRRNRTCGRYTPGVDMWTWDETVATAASLQSFISAHMLAYPAQTTVLSLVGHGSGWSPDFLLPQPSTHDVKPDNSNFGGILFDQNPASALSTAQLGFALHNAVAAAGRPIDLLYLDACLMGMAEVAYELGHAPDTAIRYLLASPSISWTSFRYDLHLAQPPGPLDPAELGRAWIDNERQELLFASDIEYPHTYTLLDLGNGKSRELLRRQNELARALIRGLETDASGEVRAAIAAAVAQAACFDVNQDHVIDQKDNYCDLASFADGLVREFSQLTAAQEPMVDIARIIQAATQIQAFLTADSDGLIVYERHHRAPHPQFPDREPWLGDNLGGLSIYLPIPGDDWKRRHYTAKFLRAAADGYWNDFLAAYHAYAEPPADVAPCGDCLPLGPEILLSQAAPSSPVNYLPALSNQR